jgi:hypothetical protein
MTRFPSMAVGAAHLALGDFSLDHRPRMIAKHPSDLPSFLPPDVVEFEADDVGLPAVNAGMSREVRKQQPSLLLDHLKVPFSGLVKVVTLVCLVVALDLLPSAAPAAHLPDAARLVLPVELLDRFRLVATCARLLFHGPPYHKASKTDALSS